MDLEQLYHFGREQVLGRHRYLANLCEPSQSLRIGPVTAVQLNPWEFGEGGAVPGEPSFPRGQLLPFFSGGPSPGDSFRVPPHRRTAMGLLTRSK